jgi:competence protein ComEC
VNEDYLPKAKSDSARSAALPNIWRGALPNRLADLRWPELWPRFQGWLETEVERRRPFNLLPVGIGIGILLYFAADHEPALWAPLLATLVAAIITVRLRRSPALFAVALALATIFAGFSAAVIRTGVVATPVLDRVRVGELQGFVESVETRHNGARLVVLVTKIAGLAPTETPKRVRVTTPGITIAPGEHFAATARLLPPPDPARPGGYDFARDSFYRGYGAVGSLMGTIRLAPSAEPAPIGLRFNAWLDRARQGLTARIVQAGGGGQAGAVAAALVTGKRGLITETSNESLRAAGIYHIVSISGLHMVLAAGTMFWSIRALLALFAGVALFWPVKKIAAVGAMIGATAYCIFSGSEVAAERSLIMTLVMLGAILCDRPALSMRNLALSAMIVLLKEPEQLLGPSFQMSFGAVALLIAGAEIHRSIVQPMQPKASLAMRMIQSLWLGIVGLAVTTMLATIATTPFSLYHFHTLNPFGLVGNALAVPLVSLVVMPGAVIGTVLYPFGLDAPAWQVMALAMQLVLDGSSWIAGFKGAFTAVPSFGPLAIGLISAALLWTAIWTTPLRWLGVLPAAAGFALAATPSKPDVYIARDGNGALVRTSQNELVIMGKPGRFVITQWLRAAGDARSPDDPALNGAQNCDPQGCTTKLRDGKTIAFARTSSAVAHDCERADLVVTPLSWRGECRAVLADRTRLAQTGAATILISDAGWTYQFARYEAGKRPWLREAPRPHVSPNAPTSQTTPRTSSDTTPQLNDTSDPIDTLE